jgi:hypothetical protein
MLKTAPTGTLVPRETKIGWLSSWSSGKPASNENIIKPMRLGNVDAS